MPLQAQRMPLQAQRMPLRAEAQRARKVQMGGGAPYPYNFITIEPTYTINDPEAVQQIMLEYVTRSKSETGLCYCGFSTTRSAPDDTAPGWSFRRRRAILCSFARLTRMPRPPSLTSPTSHL